MMPKPVKPPPGDAGRNARAGQQARQEDDRVASPLRIFSDVFEGITGSVASALLGPVVSEPSLSAKASAPSDPGGPLASAGSPRKEPRPTPSTSITGTRARPSKPLPNTRGAVDTQHPATLPPAADMLQGMTLSRLPQPPSNKRLSQLAEQGPQYPGLCEREVVWFVVSGRAFSSSRILTCTRVYSRLQRQPQSQSTSQQQAVESVQASGHRNVGPRKRP